MTIQSLEGVSKERILKELTGMMSAPYFMDEGFPLMMKTGIYEHIPGFKKLFDEMKECFQNPDWHAEGAILNVTYNSKNAYEEYKKGADVDPGYIHHIEGGKFVEQYLNNPRFIEFFNNFEIKVVSCGNVFDHTVLVMEEMQKQLFDEEGKSKFDEHDRFILMMSALLHDIGKAPAAKKNGKKHPEDAWGKTSDHDIVGAPLAFEFCKNLGMTNDDCKTIEWLVKHHMRAHQLDEMNNKCRIWKITSHPLFDKLILLARADENGCRKTKDDKWSGIDNALKKPLVAETLGVPMPPRILNGDYIIQAGYKPNQFFAKALDVAYEQQINRGITDSGALLKQVKSILKGN